MLDLHRHDEFSFYDGSGKASELAKIAKEKGFTALGLTNHGNTNGLVKHYDACKSVLIKPVMGCEGYFLPKYVEQHRGYHLILVAKNLIGYKNLNVIQSLGEEQKYYNPIWDFKMLQEHSEGLICSSACVASYSSQCIIKGEYEKAEKYLRKMKEIFGDDFYIEIQPYVISEKGVQEKVNFELIKLARKLNIKCILTSDSHRGRKEDLEAYVKMHELKNQNEEYISHVRGTYAERYMPEVTEMFTRFCKMHRDDFGVEKARRLASEMYDNLEEIEEKVSDTIIDDLASLPSLPVFDKSQNSHALLIKKVKQGLKDRNVCNKQYIARAKEELKVVKENNFDDYFLIVQDYVLWAKKQGIGVGPGRGSGCNCLLNYALGITDVDPIFFDLDYTRFIREDKKKLPDIDVDFETKRRHEVQKYIVDKYPQHACQIASYGKYKVDNLINDLAKLYNDLKDDTINIKAIKTHIASFKDDNAVVNLTALAEDKFSKRVNKTYPYFIDAFCFLYDKVKYMGTHAAGVAVSLNEIFYYTALRIDKKSGKIFSCYDLIDLERCGIIKYDVLGLNTLSSIVEIREQLNISDFDFKGVVSDKKVLQVFSTGKTNGVFQYNERTVQGILQQIKADSFDDVVAASAMNRPGPLSLGIPSIYAESKQTWGISKERPVYADAIDKTYGCILYQEQVYAILKMAGLTLNQADQIRKMADTTIEKDRILYDTYYDDYVAQFIQGMKKYGVNEIESKELFDNFLNYTFNKGHAVGYALISLEEMYYKVYYPHLFWYTKLKQADLDKNGMKFMCEAVEDGSVIFLPHVNYSADFSLRKVDGDVVIQMGLNSIKGIGDKCAKFIEDERRKNGVFTSYDNFYDRCKGRAVTSRTIEILKVEGALEFNKKIYINRVTKFNSALFSRISQ